MTTYITESRKRAAKKALKSTIRLRGTSKILAQYLGVDNCKPRPYEQWMQMDWFRKNLYIGHYDGILQEIKDARLKYFRQLHSDPKYKKYRIEKARYKRNLPKMEAKAREYELQQQSEANKQLQQIRIEKNNPHYRQTQRCQKPLPNGDIQINYAYTAKEQLPYNRTTWQTADKYMKKVMVFTAFIRNSKGEYQAKGYDRPFYRGVNNIAKKLNISSRTAHNLYAKAAEMGWIEDEGTVIKSGVWVAGGTTELNVKKWKHNPVTADELFIPKFIHKCKTMEEAVNIVDSYNSKEHQEQWMAIKRTRYSNTKQPNYYNKNAANMVTISNVVYYSVVEQNVDVLEDVQNEMLDGVIDDPPYPPPEKLVVNESKNESILVSMKTQVGRTMDNDDRKEGSIEIIVY